MVDATGSWGVEFGRDGPFMLVPKERGRSTNNQHFCHRAEIGFFSRKIKINVTRGEKEEPWKRRRKRRKSRSVWKVERKRRALCGEGGRKCVDNRICRCELYKLYGVRIMEYGVQGWKKKKGMDIFTYMLFIIICGKRGRRAIYFNCRMAISSLLAWIRPI